MLSIGKSNYSDLSLGGFFLFRPLVKCVTEKYILTSLMLSFSATIGQRLFEMVNPGTETTTYIMSNFPYLWYIVEKIEFLPKLLFKNVFLREYFILDYNNVNWLVKH